jgi:uncharacterized membrane protein
MTGVEGGGAGFFPLLVMAGIVKFETRILHSASYREGQATLSFSAGD